MGGSSEWQPGDSRAVAARVAGESELGTDTTRVQLVLPAERVRMLDQLAAEAGLATRKDLFNNALTLLVWAVGEVKRGRAIASIDESKQRFTELRMPMLDAVASNATPSAGTTRR